MGTKKAHLWKRGAIQLGARGLGAVAPTAPPGSATGHRGRHYVCNF